MIDLSNYDISLVILSYLVSVFGALVGLYVAEYIRDRDGHIQYGWLALSATLIGGCAIWAMHFTGMLAYRPGIPVTYDVQITLLSAVLPVAFTALGLYMAFRWERSILAWLAGGLALGLAVAAMHYLGMSAMRFAGQMQHDHSLVVLSVAIAIGAATAALLIVVRARGFLRMFSPLVMGLAVCGMHYTGMLAMTLVVNPDARAGVDYFTGAWSSDFMGFLSGLVVFLSLMVGTALVIFRKALDGEPGPVTLEAG